MKWLKGLKGDKGHCPKCRKSCHTIFKREDGPEACGRCFREMWQEGDVVTSAPKPEGETE